MGNKSIVVLSVVALIIIMLSGLVWEYNHSMMMQDGMNTLPDSNTTVQGNNNIRFRIV